MDPNACYSALSARDRRFDGVFYVGVTSTGIYCRPVCTAKTPKRANCRFFESREAAEKAKFRPCLKCRPELAPGTAPVDDARRIAALVAQRIDEGMLDSGGGLEKVARKFGWSSRQIRRIVHQELGVSPMELLMTRRLLLAKQLLTETTLPMTEVAFASGFASLRRFNDAFSSRYAMPPSRFRKAAENPVPVDNGATLSLLLGYRPPFDWEGLLRFLEARTLRGVENVSEGVYSRTVRLGEDTGWVKVRNVARNSTLAIELTHTLTPVLPALLGRLRNLFDLAARPDIVSAHLRRDKRLRPIVKTNPGLRVAGAFDGFELGVRAILGQQVSVKAATTISGRFAATFGDPVSTGESGLTHLTPAARRIAAASIDEIAAVGMVRSRAASIRALARAVDDGSVLLEPGSDPDEMIAALMELPGIGPWTASYIAMRALRWPDAFPREDLVLRKRLGGVTAADAESISRSWAPWRSYATMHLWSAGAIAE